MAQGLTGGLRTQQQHPYFNQNTKAKKGEGRNPLPDGPSSSNQSARGNQISVGIVSDQDRDNEFTWAADDPDVINVKTDKRAPKIRNYRDLAGEKEQICTHWDYLASMWEPNQGRISDGPLNDNQGGRNS
ncbi:uncharacterized protein BP5553_00767 [Venustampulla echinocandica]|uniref:Uncharacterized protein n=1 Tax=Venustampulla echinocandica TaxID=2656787 RepID=A0A370TZ63_9HELO|nr:uncharacterized protein BP5553_00767 [Venustampulla echinocandica]RDL40788.1 hypothetical protein BP5553_00767 [Venustampulla echinocandica]